MQFVELCRQIGLLFVASVAIDGSKFKAVNNRDRQASLTDPESRSMATSGRGSGVVGYNVQTVVDTEHHLIVTHEVTNKGSDRSQLAMMAKKTKEVLDVDKLDIIADRGDFNSTEILACDQAGIMVTLPKPSTSTAKAEGLAMSRTRMFTSARRAIASSTVSRGARMV